MRTNLMLQEHWDGRAELLPFGQRVALIVTLAGLSWAALVAGALASF